MFLSDFGTAAAGGQDEVAAIVRAARGATGRAEGWLVDSFNRAGLRHPFAVQDDSDEEW